MLGSTVLEVAIGLAFATRPFPSFRAVASLLKIRASFFVSGAKALLNDRTFIMRSTIR